MRSPSAVLTFVSILAATAGGCSSSSNPQVTAGAAPTAPAGTGGVPGATGAAGAGTGATLAGRGAATAGTPGMAGRGAAPAGTGATPTQPPAGGSGTGTVGMMMGPSAGAAGMPMTAATGCGMPKPSAKAGNACPGAPPPAMKLTEVAKGFMSPTYVAQAPGDPTRLYVLEQQGTVRVVKDGVLAAEPLIDLRDLSGAPVENATIIPNYGEGGLLGAVFDPRFAETKRFWLSYSKMGPAFTVGEFILDNPDKADVTKYKELLTFPQYGFLPGGAASNHFGSMLAFGPDGCMYVSRGDGGGENDRQMSGQKTTDDLCSILRIDPDKYPMAAPGNLAGHVWNFGFRNPWRYSFDRMTGDLYIGDVGQDPGTGFEEINIEPAGTVGRNYGWSVAQGSTVCDGDCAAMTKPAFEYGITNTQNSVIGGYVYRGTKIPGLVGRYVWADWTERKIKTLVYKGETGGVPEICDAADTTITVPTKVRSFGEGIDGEIYVVAAGAPTGGLTSAGLAEAGTLYRLDPM